MPAYKDSRSGSGAYGPDRLGWLNWSVQSTDATGVVVEVDGARYTIAGHGSLSGNAGEVLGRLRVVSGGAWQAIGEVL